MVVQLKISRLYRVGQHGLICSMSDYMLIIVLDQCTAFWAFIQLLRSRKQDPGCVMHALDGQRAFSLGYNLPGMKRTAGRFGCYADESGRNLPAYIAYIRTAEVDALARRKNGSLNGRGSLIGSKPCRIRVIIIRITRASLPPAWSPS